MRSGNSERINGSGAKLMAIIVLCAGCWLLCTPAAAGQNKLNTDYNPDKVLKSNARVNPSTLAMELSVPIGGYAGRAGTSLPVTFDYTSKVWQMRSTVTRPNSIGGTINEIGAAFARRSAAGWTSSLSVPTIDYQYDLYRADGPGVIYEGQTADPLEDTGSSVFGLYIIKRLRVNLPDGSSHELRASDAPIQCGYSDGTGCPQPDFTGIYYAVDGSRMRLEITSTSRVLYLPDGSRYLFGPDETDFYIGSLATAYIDRSGNQITYDKTNKRWTDTMGRVIDNPLPVNAGFDQEQIEREQTLTLPGFDGGTISATLSWHYLKDPKGIASGLSNPSDALGYPSDTYCNVTTTSAITGTHLFTQQNNNGIIVCNYGASAPGLAFNPVVLTKITLANNQSYQFKYNIYGEIEKIIYPTGGYERFVYAMTPAVQESKLSYDQANRGVSDRYVSAKGDGTDEIHWSYTADRGTTNNPAPYKVTVNAPDGTRTEQLLYDEPRNLNLVGGSPRPYGFDGALTGRSYEDRVYAAGSPGQLMKRHLTQYEITSVATGINPTYSNITATRDLRPIRDITITLEPGAAEALMQMSETVYDTTGSSDAAYFSALNPKQTKTYHYKVLSLTTATDLTTAPVTYFSSLAGSFGTGDLAATSETDYLYDANYQARNITGLPVETRLKDAAGVLKARSQIGYDETNYTLSSTGTMPTAAANSWIDLTSSGQLGATIGAKRGLPTTVRSYSDLAVNANLYIETHSFYDQYGNVRKMRDGRGFETEMQYDAVNAFAYPTKTISPIPGGNGSQAAFQTTVAYDYNTGLPTVSTDANNLETRMEYVDPLYRPTRMQQYFGGLPVGAATETIYGAGTSEATRYVKTRAQIDETKWKEGFSWYDGLGKPVKSQSVDATGGDVFVKTLYDAIGRVSKTSNPYRGATTADPQLEWTEVQYDAAGRAYKTITPDGAAVQTAFALATTGDTIGTAVTVTDQALKQRRSITNALGQLKRVDEPLDVGGLGAVNTPNQPTYYAYDTLNNLMTVQQSGTNTTQCGTNISGCSQTRSFAYDSLSRLKTATNPEAGAINYSYDNNGNLTSKIDARSITTSYAYDALNRVSSRSYSDGVTLPVAYTYDNLPNAKGKLTKVVTGVTPNILSTTEYQSFDTLGRVTQSQQTIDGASYGVPMTYTYNLSGAMIEQQYPSGRVVKNVLDNEGDLAIVQSKKTGNSGYFNYAKSFSYTAAGAISSMQLGNGKWESTSFNSRLQPMQIALGTVQNGTDKLKLNFAYNSSNSTTDNNGNVISQTITTPSETQGNTTYPAFVATQNYSYDALNRLKSAEETSPTQPGWKQTYLYDRYGNRQFDTANNNTTTLPLNCATAVCNPTVDPATNRLVGYTFDNAGNTKVDAENRTFIYDGENKQIEVKDTNSQTVGKYFYDGDGKRVKKVSATETTIFIYDAGGKLVAEYANQIATTATAQVNYLTSDHLGSLRINTDQNGQVISRHDYQPFGEEVQRTSYGGDAVRKQFTSYERDNETELDFAQARMYASKLGRFTVIDPIIMESVRLADPQRINLYIYVRNNPLNFTDPLGERIKVKGSDEDRQRYEDDLNKRLKDSGLQVTVNKKGFVEVKGKASDKLTSGAKLLLSAIGHDKTATISLVRNDGQVDFGTPYGNNGEVASEQRIDVGDLDVLNDANIQGFDGSNLVYHETVEAIEIQIYGSNPEKAHGQANSVAPGLVEGSLFSVPDNVGRIAQQIRNYRVANSTTQFNSLSNFGNRPTIKTYDDNKQAKSNKDKFKFRATYPINVGEIKNGEYKP